MRCVRGFPWLCPNRLRETDRLWAGGDILLVFSCVSFQEVREAPAERKGWRLPTKLDYCIAMVAKEGIPLVSLRPIHLPAHQDSQNRASSCPTFLLALRIMVVRAWRGVHRQAYDRSVPSAQPLTPLLWLDHVHARKPQYMEVTRLFAALSIGISELEAFYSDLNFDVFSEARFSP